MGVIKKLILKYRQRKIDKIQREIERLRDASAEKHIKKQEPTIHDSFIDPKTHKVDLKLHNQYVKKDPTFFMLVLIVLIAGGLLATTSLYQFKLKGINSEYTARVIEVESLKQNILEKESHLNELEEDLQETEQRGEELEDVFETERSEKTKLNDQIKLLKSEKADLESEIDRLKKTISQLDDENDALRAQISQLQS